MRQLLVRPVQVPQFAASNVTATPPSGVVPDGLIYVAVDAQNMPSSDSSSRQPAGKGERANGSDVSIPGGLLGPTTVFVVQGGINVTGAVTEGDN